MFYIIYIYICVCVYIYIHIINININIYIYTWGGTSKKRHSRTYLLPTGSVLGGRIGDLELI